jgi:hypothetical protein
MPADLTATGLISSVRRNAALGPNATTSFPTDEDILAWMNEEMTNRIVTMLMRPREERFVEYYEFTTTSGEAEYGIPSASLWDDTRDVQAFVSNNWASLPRIMPETASFYLSSSQTSPQATAYYLRGNNIVLNPVPSAAQRVRIKYFNRPGYIVSTGYYQPQSTPTGPVLGAYTFQMPSGVTFSAPNGYVDFVSVFAPFAPILSSVEVAESTVDYLTLNMTSEQFDSLPVNYNSYYIVSSGDAPGPQISQDLASLLEQWTTLRCLIAKKDTTGVQIQLRNCEQSQKAIVEAMNKRTDGLGQKVVPRAFGFGFRNGWGTGGPFT